MKSIIKCFILLFTTKPGCVFDQFPRCDMKVLLGDFSAKVGREDISKPTIGNES
jgi:hypothetical protein